jgi:hypothetical protein
MCYFAPSWKPRLMTWDLWLTQLTAQGLPVDIDLFDIRLDMRSGRHDKISYFAQAVWQMTFWLNVAIALPLPCLPKSRAFRDIAPGFVCLGLCHCPVVVAESLSTSLLKPSLRIHGQRWRTLFGKRKSSRARGLIKSHKDWLRTCIYWKVEHTGPLFQGCFYQGNQIFFARGEARESGWARPGLVSCICSCRECSALILSANLNFKDGQIGILDRLALGFDWWAGRFCIMRVFPSTCIWRTICLVSSTSRHAMFTFDPCQIQVQGPKVYIRLPHLPVVPRAYFQAYQEYLVWRAIVASVQKNDARQGHLGIMHDVPMSPYFRQACQPYRCASIPTVPHQALQQYQPYCTKPAVRG